MLELVIDNFAGGGGASVGIESALGRVDAAINHDPRALAIHEINHPLTRHFCKSIYDVHPREVTGGRPVGLAWFSPDCKHFSKAKGGKPVQQTIRDLAWVVVHWAKEVRPRVIILENVEEFTTWGPLDPTTGRPCKVQSGLTFRRWVKELEKLGYRVEWRELRACDYGAPTTRKRLFLVARCDGMPIVWPEPTHGPGRPLPYRTAAECIDWTIPALSIFEREENGRPPLAEATKRRIAKGVHVHVIEEKNPFIIPLTHHGADRTYDIRDPFRTITCANRGEMAYVAPTICGVGGRAGQSRPRTGGEPLATITTKADAAVCFSHLMAPWFIPRYGERPGQDPRTRSIQRPHPTIVPTQNGAQLCAAFMAQHNTGVTGRGLGRPLSTICTTGSHQQLVTSHLMVQRNNAYGQSLGEPLRTVCAGTNHFAEVRTFLTKYYGSGGSQSVGDPLHSVTTRDRFGLVNVAGHGDFQIVDILMRMLVPRELFRAQGFPDWYILDPIYKGRPLAKTHQVRACGNSVCPPLAEAMVRANVQLRHVFDIEDPMVGGLFG